MKELGQALHHRFPLHSQRVREEKSTKIFHSQTRCNLGNAVKKQVYQNPVAFFLWIPPLYDKRARSHLLTYLYRVQKGNNKITLEFITKEILRLGSS